MRSAHAEWLRGMCLPVPLFLASYSGRRFRQVVASEQKAGQSLAIGFGSLSWGTKVSGEAGSPVEPLVSHEGNMSSSCQGWARAPGNVSAYPALTGYRLFYCGLEPPLDLLWEKISVNLYSMLIQIEIFCIKIILLLCISMTTRTSIPYVV